MKRLNVGAALRKLKLRVRLDAFREIHERWEFDDFTEATFDAWLHDQIRAMRQTLAAIDSPAEDAVGKPDASTSGCAFAHESSARSAFGVSGVPQAPEQKK